MTTYHCIDGHTCGNPVRLVLTGHPQLEGSTQAQRREHFMRDFDPIRRGLMFEPRGHAQMSGAFLYPSTREDCDIAVLYIETSGCLPMCGHGTIGVVTFAIERQLVKPKHSGMLALDTPAGRVLAYYQWDEVKKRVRSVALDNVASFLLKQDVEINIPALGSLVLDVAYGGNFYPIIESQKNFRDMADFSSLALIEMGRQVRDTLNQYNWVHPLYPHIQGIRHCMWTGKALSDKAHARNAVLYGQSALDRSPCGTGTSARLAQRYARGLLQVGETFVHESIIGSHFQASIQSTLDVAGLTGVIPRIEGWAVITGESYITLDSQDPYAYGFELI